MREPRQYQVNAINAIRDAFKRGLRGVIIVMPTGMGKAMVISTVAKLVLAKGKRVLVLVNRDNLIEQLRDSLIEQGMMPLIERGMDKASPMSDCVIGSIQTLQGKRLKRWNRDHFDLIFCDECHGSAAASFHNVLDYFNGQHVGCTATPERHDKAGLWKGYAEICYQKTFAEAVNEGWLCDFEFHELPVPIFVSNEAATKRMWTENDETLSLRDDLPRIFEAAANVSEGRKTLAFWSNCNSSLEADKYFRAHGLESMHVEGPGGPAMMNRERVNEVIEWFKQPGPRILHNCQLLTTGFDQPDIDQIIMGRLVRSEPLVRQMLGRGTRAACVIDGLPDAESRKSVIAASSKPICRVQDLMIQLGDVRNRFADASVLITQDDKERQWIKEIARNASHPFTMAELENKLRAKRDTDKEAALAKLLEDTANAQHKAKQRSKWNGQGPFVDYIFKMQPQNSAGRKPASEKQVSYLRQHFKYRGEIPSIFHASLLITAYKRHEDRMNAATIPV